MKPKPNLRRNFGWALYGHGVYQASQWLTLVVIAKLLDVTNVGTYAIALAISTPITTFAGLRIRQVQVTDARDENLFGHFLAVQMTALVLSICIVSIVLFPLDYGLEVKALVIVVMAGQCLMLLRGVFIGFNQKHERMDTIAVSQTLLSLSSLAALFVMILVTGNLLAGLIAMQACKVVVLVLVDVPMTGRLIRQYTGSRARDYLRPIFDPRAMLRLTGLCLPLGVTGLLMSVNNSIPKYFIMIFLGEAPLGFFAAILALVLAGMALTQSAAKSVMPRLSRYYLDDKRRYIKLLLKLIGLGGGLGAVGMVIVLLAGEEILRLLFTPEYADYTDLFVWSMLFGVLAYMVTFIGTGVTAMRVFTIQPIITLSALLTTTIFGYLLIPDHGLNAAVWSMMAGKFVQGAVGTMIIGRGLLKHRDVKADRPTVVSRDDAPPPRQ